MKRTLSMTIILAMLAACPPVRAETLWRIGAADDDTADLAGGRDRKDSAQHTAGEYKGDVRGCYDSKGK